MFIIFHHADRWKDLSKISKYYDKIGGGGAEISLTHKSLFSKGISCSTIESLRKIKS